MIRFKDDREAQAWDLYAAAFANRETNLAENTADDADELLEERRKRAWNYCRKCECASEWFHHFDAKANVGGRRCANCGTVAEGTP